MRAKIFLSIIALIFIGSALNVPLAQSKEVIKLKFGHTQPASHYYHKMGQTFATKVAKYSDSKISVEVYPSSQLGAERDLIEGLRIGTVQGYIGAMAVLTQFVPEFIVLQLPYVIKNYEHGVQVWSQILSQKVSAKMDKAGLRVLGFVKSSPRGVQTSKPIMKMADLKGLRIRTMESNIYIDAYKALATIPTPVPYSELVSALQSGVVDGADQGFTAYLSTKAYQVSPFYAHIEIVQTLSPFLMSESIWKKMPKELKEAISKGADEAINEQTQMYEEEVRRYEKAAKESKFPFCYTFPDLTEFRDAVKPVYSKYENEVGKDTLQKILSLK